MTEQSPITKRTRKVRRSPSYPAIDLEIALQRTRVLFEKEGRHPAPIAAVVQHWGYGPKSSSGLVAVAALKKFGLVDESGSGPTRALSLSALALRILLDERPDSPERASAIREAALSPAIHSELWQKYQGSVPSDATLRHFLRLEKNFTESAVAEFIAEFRRTIEFSRLAESGVSSDFAPDAVPRKSDSEIGLPMVAQLPVHGSVMPKQAMRVFYLPLLDGGTATLQVPSLLSEEAWRHMIAVLDAMKPALIRPSREGSEGQDEESK